MRGCGQTSRVPIALGDEHVTHVFKGLLPFFGQTGVLILLCFTPKVQKFSLSRKLLSYRLFGIQTMNPKGGGILDLPPRTYQALPDSVCLA